MGFLLGIVNGLVTSFEHLNLRRAEAVDTVIINVLRFGFSAGVLALLNTVLVGWSWPTTTDWAIIAGSLVAETLIMFLYVRSFQYGEQSLVGPLFSLSLVFLVPIGVIWLGEVPTVAGYAGLGLVVIGALVVGIDVRRGVLAQWQTLCRNRGVRYMLAASLAAAVAISVVKFAIQSGFHPITFGFWVTSLLFLTHVPFAWQRYQQLTEPLPKAPYLAAAFFSVGQVCHYVGVSLLYTAYYIALKRSSIIFDTVIGWHFGKEGNFGQRFVGALVIFAGLIAIFVA